MSTLRVTAEVLTIHEHPNADALELAQVGLYRAVVAKAPTAPARAPFTSRSSPCSPASSSRSWA